MANFVTIRCGKGCFQEKDEIMKGRILRRSRKLIRRRKKRILTRAIREGRGQQQKHGSPSMVEVLEELSRQTMSVLKHSFEVDTLYKPV